MGSLKYIIVMDFEATCDIYEEEDDLDDMYLEYLDYENEIIEFPAVLMNLGTGDIEDRFQKYVRPTENPILSSFCRQLTGIRQNDVNNANVLSKVISEFDDWLKDVLTRKSLTLAMSTTGPFDCIFVTWGNDFERFLAPECKRKNLTKPNYFNQLCDLQSTFSRKYTFSKRHGWFGKPSLRKSMKHLGVSFSGRQHCGLDDATNTANLAYAMHKRGIGLELTH